MRTEKQRGFAVAGWNFNSTHGEFEISQKGEEAGATG